MARFGTDVTGSIGLPDADARITTLGQREAGPAPLLPRRATVSTVLVGRAGFEAAYYNPTVSGDPVACRRTCIIAERDARCGGGITISPGISAPAASTGSGCHQTCSAQ